jgi:poly-gamma-glutamate synthesis protein (capsule biosynthesis protein)
MRNVAPSSMKDRITLFLSGDVMTGRGIDQILPFPGNPRLYEPAMISAAEYVAIAEEATGPIPHPVEPSYIWGDALREFAREQPQAKIINLETAVTRSGTYWEGKGVHYKMTPENARCLTAAEIDCCALANNHTLDWGVPGLLDTIEILDRAGIKHAGAGRNVQEAQAPAILAGQEATRVIVFSLGSLSSGIPGQWSAGENKPGINIIEKQPADPVAVMAERIRALRVNHDIVVVSIHWGGNWGYKIPSSQIRLAHRLINEAKSDLIHGHSSHHVKAIEVYNGSLILYGCGDFLNDYEGIGGYENFRGDLGLMYFADLDRYTHRLIDLRMVPTQVRRFRVNRACAIDSHWIEDLLNREGKRFGTRVKRTADNVLRLDLG